MISRCLHRQHVHRHHDHSSHGHVHRTPSDVQHHDTTEEFLTLHVAAATSAPERLLLIGRPDEQGFVRVREWSSQSWNSEGEDYDIDAEELLAGLERDYSARRAMSEDIYRLRHWLTGW